MLPIKAIDRLFERLALTYGTQWDRMWEGRPIGEVKTAWSGELSGYGSDAGLKAIAWALENLPDRAPNLIQFRNLCRMAPAVEGPRLPEPKADPERVAAELAKLAPLRAAVKTSRYDHKGWARKIVARQEAGEQLNATVLLFARQALGAA